MSDNKIEKVFTVEVPIEKAWHAFADSHERSQWEASTYEIDPVPGGRVHWTLPGIESDGRVEEVDPPHRLRHVEMTGPHVSAEITVVLEEVEGGTRITVTHAGFGDGADWDEWLEGTSIGWSQAIADLVLYLRTGVPARRFVCTMHSPGMHMTDTPAGIEVVQVEPGRLGDLAGVRPGDVLLRVAGVPVFSITDVWVLMRSAQPGDEIAIEYVSDGDRCEGKGTLVGGW